MACNIFYFKNGSLTKSLIKECHDIPTVSDMCTVLDVQFILLI